MQVGRLSVSEQVKNQQVLIELHDTFNDRRVEILTIDEPTPHRCPHPDIAGQVKIHGDILSSISETDWNLPDSNGLCGTYL